MPQGVAAEERIGIAQPASASRESPKNEAGSSDRHCSAHPVAIDARCGPEGRHHRDDDDGDPNTVAGEGNGVLGGMSQRRRESGDGGSRPDQPSRPGRERGEDEAGCYEPQGTESVARLAQQPASDGLAV